MAWLQNLRDRARVLKRDLTALAYAAQDPRVPWTAKVLAALALGYALSPVDLIPDFIPVLGLLDDLLLVPALLTAAIRLIPPDVWAEARQRAAAEPLSLRKNWGVGVVFVLIWLLVLGLIVLALVPSVSR